MYNYRYNCGAYLPIVMFGPAGDIRNGSGHVIVNIGMRMLSSRELFNCQGFPRNYKISPVYKGKPLPKTKQISCCGNSVPPNTVAAHIEANCNWLKRERRAS